MSSEPQIIPLCVPPWEERTALSRGARFSKENGIHLTANDNTYDYLEWLPRRYDPRAKSPFLLPDMLPPSTWGINVRSSVSEERWDELRRYTYAAAGYRCEACGSGGQPHVEAHELWKFDESSLKQKLVRLVCLCPLCHKAKHLGNANRLGMLEEVQDHLREINGWNVRELVAHLERVTSDWERRSKLEWELDLGWLLNYRVTSFGRPPKA